MRKNGFLTACGMQVHGFLNLATKGNGTLLCNSMFAWSEANSLVSSFIHVFHNYFWLTTMYWDWTRHVDTMMTNRVSAF